MRRIVIAASLLVLIAWNVWAPAEIVRVLAGAHRSSVPFWLAFTAMILIDIVALWYSGRLVKRALARRGATGAKG